MSAVLFNFICLADDIGLKCPSSTRTSFILHGVQITGDYKRHQTPAFYPEARLIDYPVMGKFNPQISALCSIISHSLLSGRVLFSCGTTYWCLTVVTITTWYLWRSVSILQGGQIYRRTHAHTVRKSNTLSMYRLVHLLLGACHNFTNFKKPLALCHGVLLGVYFPLYFFSATARKTRYSSS